ncbi:hypothetical protein GOBAR_DD11409 [Gossypium barbadense]|nr:hypothetical protein GOBAR_DD11409 [Gossypium barbadense]
MHHPVIPLSVKASTAKFKGSDVVERQNDHFSGKILKVVPDLLSAWLWVQTLETASVNRGSQHTLDLPLVIAKIFVHWNIHLYMFLPSKRQAQVVSYLCKQKADVGAAAMDGMGAIHFAAQKGHLEVV